MSKFEKVGEKSWIIEVEQAPDGEHFIQLNDEILDGSGFAIGDELDWKDNGDGSYTLTKKKPTVWVQVDCISQMRVRYMVEVPADHPEYALDTVTCEEAKEFSQEWLGETIVSHRVISESDALKLCDKDNDYAVGWKENHKIKTFFTKMEDYE